MKRILQTIPRPAIAAATLLLLAACGSAAPAPASPKPAPASSAASVASGAASPKPNAPAGSTSAKPSAAASSGAALPKIAVRMGYKMIGQYIPASLMIEQGKYKAAGIDVSLKEGTGSVTSAELVGNGTNPIGLIDATAAALTVSKGLAEKVVAITIQKSPTAVITLASKNIKTPKDLIGKTIAYDPGSNVFALFPAFLKANGLTTDQVKTVGAAGHAKVAAIAQNKVDGLLGLVNDEVFDVEAETKGAPLNNLIYADYGVPFIGPVSVVVNNKFLQAHPDQVRAFIKVTLEGVQAAQKDPQAAVAAANKEFPLTKTDILMGQWKATVPLLQSKSTAGHPIGWQSDQDWTTTLNLMKQYINPKLDPTPSLYYTNDYLPKQ